MVMLSLCYNAQYQNVSLFSPHYGIGMNKSHEILWGSLLKHVEIFQLIGVLEGMLEETIFFVSSSIPYFSWQN